MLGYYHVQVSSYDVLQHGRFAARLAAHDGDLGQVDGIIDTDSRKDILKLVDKATGQMVSDSANMRRERGGWVPESTNVMSAGSEMPPGVASDPLMVAEALLLF